MKARTALISLALLAATPATASAYSVSGPTAVAETEASDLHGHAQPRRG